MALQLATLGPYLDDIEEEGAKDELLKQIAAKIFGQPRREGADWRGVGETPATAPQLIALVKEISKLTG